jgi:hypothetical protein
MEFVLENRRTTIHETADIVGISFQSVHSILKDNVNMCLTAIDFVLRHLSVVQKENHTGTCQDFRERPRIHFENNHRFTGISHKLRRYNDTSTIQAKFWDTLDAFQTTLLQIVAWICCISQGDYFKKR